MMSQQSEPQQEVWLITGASRGLGAKLARAALEAGHAVVATGRDAETVADAVGESDDLLVTELHATGRPDAEATAEAAVNRFGRIDVLVNNTRNIYAGYFEELAPEQIGRQLAATLWSAMDVTRAVLPVMREQRSGHVISISAGPGLVGFERCSAYTASKFGLEGWMMSLQPEVDPFDIDTTIVNPGPLHAERFTEESAFYADPPIEDYEGRREAQLTSWYEHNQEQPGDPPKLAEALLTIADEAEPPNRFIAGSDAIELAERWIADLQEQIDAYRDLSTSLAHDDA